MQTILPAYALTMHILGKQKRKDVPYRFSHFCVRCPAEGGTLLLNTLTLQLVFLEDGEPFPEDALIEDWFLVPEAHDDNALSRQVRGVLKLMQPAPERISQFVIFTTSDCNARCFYCFEAGWRRVPMTQDTAEKAASFILRTCKGKPVHLSWFGGEPMLGADVIDTISTRLQEADVPYRSKMTTNLSLFTPELADRAVSLWHLDRLQVTLDGTHDVYNRIKAYADKSYDAYARVMENIGLLLDRGVRVSVRLNMDLHNADDLFALVRELASRFPDRGLQVSPALLFEGTSEHPALRSEAARDELFRKMQALLELIRALKLGHPARLSRRLKLNMCYADSGQAVTIRPDGTLGVCEHDLTGDQVGTVLDPEPDRAAMATYHALQEELPECAACPFYPSCIRLAHCEPKRLCRAQERALRLSQLQQQMLLEYEEYLHPSHTSAPDETETVLEEIT